MDFSAIFLGQKVYFLLFWCMIAGSLAKLVVKEKEAADLQLDQVETIWIVMLNPPRETEFPSAFYKINIFDDQQVRTHKGNDRVQDVTSINIGIGGDGKDILLGGDGNQENVFAIANLLQWNVPVISQSYTGSAELEKKKNTNYFQNHVYFMIGTHND